MESEDIVDKEIESWKGFEYALREVNRTIFNKMLSNKRRVGGEYADCMSAKGENFSTEVLLRILIYEQQKMINELITRLAEDQIGLGLLESLIFLECFSQA